MKDNNLMGTPFDYSERKINVFIELISKDIAKSVIKKVICIENKDIIEMKYGLQITLSKQQIPDVVRALSKENVAIYGIIQK